jgi:hypothetical protein
MGHHYLFLSEQSNPFENDSIPFLEEKTGYEIRIFFS